MTTILLYALASVLTVSAITFYYLARVIRRNFRASVSATVKTATKDRHNYSPHTERVTSGQARKIGASS